jgi:F-type H+-transporting ATPase subunit b
MGVLSKLGIDWWQILLYLVNFGLIVLLLSKFLYKPLLNYLDKRRDLIKKNIDEAENLKREFDLEIKKQEAQTKKLLDQMNQEVAKAKQNAEIRAEELLQKAEEERKQIVAETKKQVEIMKNKIHEEVEQEIIVRMEETILDVLQNKVPKDIVKQSVKDSWKQLI